jgi:hypothetical protein
MTLKLKEREKIKREEEEKEEDIRCAEQILIWKKWKKEKDIKGERRMRGDIKS